MQSSQTPKNFFIQVGIIVSLYVSAVSFLVFVFSVIDDVFPKALDYYSMDSNNVAIRFSISILIISFPLFIWLGRVYRKFVSENQEVKESKLRKWMIYFTLFVTGLTMAIDAIVLINTFLGGEDFALSFFLKVLSVFVVASAIFTSCLKDLNGYFDSNPSKSKLWATIVSVLMLVSIIAGFVFIGSPTQQRNVARDNQRIVDLQGLQWQIVNYYQAKSVLPPTLEALKDPLSGDIVPTDPETNESYGYNITGKFTFSLCANFKTVSKNGETSFQMMQNEDWQHKAEKTCFERTIDPEKYPVTRTKAIN